MTSRRRRARRRHRRLALVQGLVYLATGLWPVVALRSFEAVTGRKREGWLVRTTGALIALVGATLARPALTPRRDRSGPRPRPDPLLGFGTAAILGTVDVVGVAVGRLRPVYLADAALEGLLALAWLLTRGPIEPESVFAATAADSEQRAGTGRRKRGPAANRESVPTRRSSEA